MKTRWMLAGLGGVAFVVLLTWVPFRSFSLAGGATSGGTTAASSSQGAACGSKAEPANLSFTLKDMNGKDVKLSDFKGKVVLINFWATWCPPCKAEIPDLVALKAKYGSQGFEVLGISVDDPIENLKPFAERFEVNYPLLVGFDRDDVQQAYGPIYGIPVSMLISRDGRICTRFVAMISKERVEQEIRSLL
jgi:peroxiredoxin